MMAHRPAPAAIGVAPVWVLRGYAKEVVRLNGGLGCRAVDASIELSDCGQVDKRRRHGPRTTIMPAWCKTDTPEEFP